ncbi:MAG TPA: HAD family hydrolase [Candidatus Angelobacter sp.]|nr:HAD family hydrolase [Candidatus Angelobacter sp.]
MLLTTTSGSSTPRTFIAPSFRWNAADAFLFDIDGTLVNSSDRVHYNAFHAALRQVFGTESKIDHVPVQGNTDVGILRAVLRGDGRSDEEIDRYMPRMVEVMNEQARCEVEDMRPEPCPSAGELVGHLHAQGKLLGASSGNLETIGWLKLERAGLRSLFSLGAFSWPLEHRADIFQHGVNQVRERLGSAAQVCVWGDTPVDIQAARRVGIPVIAMATGIYQFEHLLALQPDACFSSFAEALNSI